MNGECKETGDRYSTLYDAKMACSSDANCIGIFNKNCDNGDTETCIGGIKLDSLPNAPCVYKKNEVIGMYQPKICILLYGCMISITLLEFYICMIRNIFLF